MSLTLRGEIWGLSFALPHSDFTSQKKIPDVAKIQKMSKKVQMEKKECDIAKKCLLLN